MSAASTFCASFQARKNLMRLQAPGAVPHNRSPMKFDSPIFDSVRVKPDQDRRLRATCPMCNWPGCEEAAPHRAPKGRLREGEYWRFCLEHVREYNSTYNFFAGMSDDAVAKYQKDDITGHRPTWKMGSLGGKRSSASRADFRPPGWAWEDPFGLFGETAAASGRH